MRFSKKKSQSLINILLALSAISLSYEWYIVVVNCLVFLVLYIYLNVCGVNCRLWSVRISFGTVILLAQFSLLPYCILYWIGASIPYIYCLFEIVITYLRSPFPQKIDHKLDHMRPCMCFHLAISNANPIACFFHWIWTFFLFGTSPGFLSFDHIISSIHYFYTHHVLFYIIS